MIKIRTALAKLQKRKLVKHSLEEIENSDLFKYSPYKELNDSQRKAVEDILAQIGEWKCESCSGKRNAEAVRQLWRYIL